MNRTPAISPQIEAQIRALAEGKGLTLKERWQIFLEDFCKAIRADAEEERLRPETIPD